MDFLDYLTAFLHCQYLSDLKYITITLRQAEKILALSETIFPLEDYNQAARYLSGNHCSFQNIYQAKLAIVQTLLIKK